MIELIQYKYREKINGDKTKIGSYVLATWSAHSAVLGE